MKVCLYVGDHAADGFAVRLGWYLTRLAQKGPYGEVTHIEAIHEEHTDGTVTIAGASVRDEGVRGKRCYLNTGHWLIADVPQWDVQKSIALLAQTRGAKYDWRGALATQLPGSPQAGRWFCNEWVGQPFIKAPATFGPHQFAAVALTLGSDVTAEFFGSRS